VLGGERLTADAAAARVITEYRIADSPLGRFVKGASIILMLLVRLHGLPPLGASAEAVTQWVQRIRRAYLLRWMIEPFSLRWNAQRRPRVQLITMGTPFFQKSWLNPSHAQKRASRLMRAGAVVAVMVAAVYAGAVALAPLLSLVHMSLIVPGSRLWLVISLVVILAFISTWWVRQSYWRDDANIYFAVPQTYMSEQPREARERWQLLAIHAGLLDEALLGLSAEPLVAAGLGPLLRRPLVPSLRWGIGKDPIGLISPVTPLVGDFARLARQCALVCALWIHNLTVGFVLRTVAWIVAFVAHGFLLNAAIRLVSSIGMGVPDDELSDSRMSVIPVPSLGAFFAQESWDATQVLIEEPAKAPTPREQHLQWRFLSDPQALEAEIRTSLIWPYLKARQSDRMDVGSAVAQPERLQIQRTSVALEHRIREALGLVPLNHSSYYGNSQVIERIGRAMKAWSDTMPGDDEARVMPIDARTLPGGL
jgi:hypothetical protein